MTIVMVLLLLLLLLYDVAWCRSGSGTGFAINSFLRVHLPAAPVAAPGQVVHVRLVGIVSIILRMFPDQNVGDMSLRHNTESTPRTSSPRW